MKMGLGTVQLGLDYGIANQTGKPDRQESLAVLRAAAVGGITCLDTAANYGDSEMIIGRFIKESGMRPRISTKFSGADDCDHAARALNASLERLGVDEVDYFLLHKPDEVLLQGFDQTIAMLNDHPAVGKTGVSVYSAAEVDACLRHGGIQVLQLPFNIMDTRLIRDGALRRIKEQGIELHVRSVYLQGLLMVDAPAKPQGVGRYLDILKNLARSRGIGVKELCFLYVRDCPYIDRFFIGCETVPQVVENLRMYELPTLGEGITDEVMRAFADVPEEILNPSLWR